MQTEKTESAGLADRIIFLKGKKVILRPIRESTDLEACLRWMNDPEVRIFIKRYSPATIQDEKEWFERLNKNPNDIVLGIETLEGKLIGIMGLHRINWKDRTATTGAVIGEKEYWGKGYGTDAKMILLDYAFNTLNLRKIKSDAWSYNKRSIAYSLHCGYKLEATLKKERFVNGRYWDKVLLAVFRKDWLPIWKLYQKTGKVR